MTTSERPGAAGGGPFQIAGWRVEPAANRLLREGEEVRLEPRAMRVLVYLAEHPGRVVSRQELEAVVWRGMVVSYDALTNAIVKLRRAFDDDPRHPTVIETISKNGYRLIAKVARVAETPSAPAPEALPESAPAAEPSKRQGRRPALAAGLAAVLLTILAIGAWLLRPEPDGNGAPAPGRPPTVAVLPFQNLSAQEGKEYFADGITEDLITDLSRVSGIHVLASDSVFPYKGSAAPERRIGRELGVRYLLRGSVRREGGRLRLNVRLVDSGDGRALWAERYDRELTDIFRIQDELTARIVSALEVELAPADRRRLARDYEASVDAYDALLRGLADYGRRSQEGNELAKRHFERAIALDPGFARAYAALALAHSRDAVDGWTANAADALGRAEILVDQAARLDPSVPQIYFVRGQIALYRADHAQAIRQAEQAIVREPGYADGHALLAWVLHFAGRPAQGLEVMERAVRLNPRMPSIYRLVRGALHYSLGYLDRAAADLEPAVDMNPTYQMLRLWLAAAYAGSGELEAARWQAAELRALNPDFVLEHVRRAYPIRDPVYRERLLADLRKAGLE